MVKRRKTKHMNNFVCPRQRWAKAKRERRNALLYCCVFVPMEDTLFSIRSLFHIGFPSFSTSISIPTDPPTHIIAHTYIHTRTHTLFSIEQATATAAATNSQQTKFYGLCLPSILSPFSPIDNLLFTSRIFSFSIRIFPFFLSMHSLYYVTNRCYCHCCCRVYHFLNFLSWPDVDVKDKSIIGVRYWRL